ncbi:MAG: HDOD domain-containing protein [Pseudomonadales bacterium]
MIDSLPCMPQLLLRLINVLYGESNDIDGITITLRQDAVMTAKLLAAAHSAPSNKKTDPTSLENAISLLGIEEIKQLVVATASHQFFTDARPAGSTTQWSRTLANAIFARELATISSFPNVEQAYLCGLFIELGESAAELLDLTQRSTFAGDAIRYYQENTQQVLDAHPLVKILHLATQLSNEDELTPETIDTAKILFQLDEMATTQFHSRIKTEVNQLLDAYRFDDDIQAWKNLGSRLAELNSLNTISSRLWQARGQRALLSVIRHALNDCFGIQHCSLFEYESGQNILALKETGSGPGYHAELCVPLEKNRSLVSDAILEGRCISSRDYQNQLSVVDRQLIRHCQSDHIMCWPLESDNGPLGVLVFGINEEQLSKLLSQQNLGSSLRKQISTALDNDKSAALQIDGDVDIAADYQHKIKEAVHEASNPLSIIRNYLETLTIKLGEQHNAGENLKLIKEEIDRVSLILSDLRDKPTQAVPKKDSININRVIEDTALIFQSSIADTNKLSLRLRLDEQHMEIAGNANHLKQILTNLLKNAGEALANGGLIVITSDASVSIGGKRFFSIAVSDDGPGINDEIKAGLFYPGKSSKGITHSGLGLSIVKKLVDKMDGSILCRSSKGMGTQFEILLPITIRE